MTFVEISGGTVVTITTNTPPAGWINVTNATPQPGLGWTTPDNGVTWVAPTPTSIVGNQQALLTKAANALANNVTFLGLASPTNAQAIAQIQALTRQVNALIMLETGELSSTTGT